MVFWRTAPPAQPAVSAGMDHGEEMVAEVEEPPDELRSKSNTMRPPSRIHSDLYNKSAPFPRYERRESLLTRQLHSETEHSDEDVHAEQPARNLSKQSTWSSQSTASTAELTSDDGRSMASPAISPPLPPTQARTALPILEKSLDKKLEIVGQEDASTSSAKESGSEKSVEATLGRKRCIMFACGGKDKPKATSPPPAEKEPEKPVSTSPAKRKCTIKFACPTKAAASQKAAEKVEVKPEVKRPASPPPPPERRPSGSGKLVHRNSDSTVTHGSPRSIRRSRSNITATTPTPISTEPSKPLPVRRISNDSEESATEATRFHEFASSEDEPEEWVQESTCHRSRLTVSDTLKKENVIRKACEEVEEEAIEEDEEDEDEDEVDEAAGVDDDPDVEDEDEDDESEKSDAGFHSDDEEGFAASDDEGEDSDYEWWKPGGSTAATSVEHLDRLHIHTKQDDEFLGTSAGSASSGQASPRPSRHHFHQTSRKEKHSHAMAIPKQQEDADLPDSTDFVCGTLDEDRPMEQAYLNRKKDLEAAKRKLRPQDIDPSFPTSDPEMDEEDDEDLEDPEEDDEEDLVHGKLEELHGNNAARGRPAPMPRRKSNPHRSPPPARQHSPPPKRMRSPPPTKRGTARSPPPRKLFGHSPKRMRSPAPVANPMTSPPNTRRSSPSGRGTAIPGAPSFLGERPQLTHTASLPRGGFLLSKMGGGMRGYDDPEGSETVSGAASDIPKRGAIDIVKGLEKKRQRRKEKMWQKMCAKNAAKGDKAYKVKPGKGAERMREVGLELQKYHGKGEHILSV